MASFDRMIEYIPTYSNNGHFNFDIIIFYEFIDLVSFCDKLS